MLSLAKNPMAETDILIFFAETDILILKFMCKCTGPRIAKTNWKKNKLEKNSWFPNLVLSCSNPDCVVLAGGSRRFNEIELSPEMHPCILVN